MEFKIKKYLKNVVYPMLVLIFIITILWTLIFSHPLFLNAYTDLLIEGCGIDPETVDFQTYSKEEFSAEFLNNLLGPEDDFITLFESHYGTENKREGIITIAYDIKNPNDPSRYTLYRINKYTDLVYKNDRQICPSCKVKHYRSKLMTNSCSLI